MKKICKKLVNYEEILKVGISSFFADFVLLSDKMQDIILKDTIMLGELHFVAK